MTHALPRIEDNDSTMPAEDKTYGATDIRENGYLWGEIQKIRNAKEEYYESWRNAGT